MHLFDSEAFNLKAQFKNLMKVQNIAICGLMIALYIVLSQFNIRLSSFLEIRFAFLILAVSGMMGGPIMGMLVGCCSDIVSTLLSGQAFFFGFTFSYSLMGFLFGLILYRRRPTVPRAIACSVAEVCISLSLHTLWLSMLYGTPFLALLTTRVIKCCIQFFVNCVLLYLILGVFSRVLQTLHLTTQSE
ncbi:MAG: folate family ECF transporter S component [Clostridiales bacterium]|nr:folate family ECF transporter S component [Clostridiales bacterium]